jgi:mannosyltransferase
MGCRRPPRRAGVGAGAEREQRIRWLFLLLACGLGFALCVWRLQAQPLWFDEGLSVDLALAPPRYVLETIDRPPLYYLLLHRWAGVAGLSPFTLRFFSAWWGTLALPLFYRLGRELLGRRGGDWALGLAVFSPFYVYYAQEARTYALTLSLALASSWALLAWLAGGRRRWAAAGLRALRREARWLFVLCLALVVLAWGLGDWFFRLHGKVA